MLAEQVGPNYDREQMYVACRRIDRVQDEWRASSFSGAALYEFAETQARELGWQLNLKVAGHRLADFPHKVLCSGSLALAQFKPASDLWVLKMQIKHSERPFGAFYEDLLTDAHADEACA